MTKFQGKSRKNPDLKAVPSRDALRTTLAQDVVDSTVVPAEEAATTRSETQPTEQSRTSSARPIFPEHLMLSDPQPMSEDTGQSSNAKGNKEGSEADPSTSAQIAPSPTAAASAQTVETTTQTTVGAHKPVMESAPLTRHRAMPLPSAPPIGGVGAIKLQRAPARPNTSPTDRIGDALPASGQQPVRWLPENQPAGRLGEGNAAASLPRPTSPANQKTAESVPGKPVAAAAQLRPRHHGIFASFLALVLLPVVLVATYLWVFAVDQYASTVGFSVRTEEMSSALGILGGITRLSGGGSSDSDILYDYIHSQELVTELDSQIDLRSIYAQAWPRDRVFAFDPERSIEDLVDHWERMVKITYDNSSGLMTLRVLAFDPEQATLIATKIVEQSTQKINALSDEAREDATRYAAAEMERALERLKLAREAMTGFRTRTQMVDPVADLQGQMGILNNLQANLAESYIELDLLQMTTNATDPRILQVEQRITVIQSRIEEERRKFSESGQGPRGEDYATMVAEFERLSVDREFAEQSYRVALAAYDSALAEAQRKSRYLATHIRPTLAEESKFPQRGTLLGMAAFFLLMAWAIGLLIIYSIRDRR